MMRNKCKVPNCSVCQGGIATNILVKFLGQWSVYMRCRSRRQALAHAEARQGAMLLAAPHGKSLTREEP